MNNIETNSEVVPNQNKPPQIYYFRDKGFVNKNSIYQKGAPIACLVYSVDRVNNKLLWEYSVHNPKDRFDRNVARKVALGRFRKHPKIMHVDRENAPLKDLLHDLCLNIVDLYSLKIIGQEISPRLVKAVSYHLDHVNYTNVILNAVSIAKLQSVLDRRTSEEGVQK